MNPLLLTLTVFCLCLLKTGYAQDPEAFSKAAATAAKSELPADYTGVKGADADWYFFYKELAHVGTGQFWTKDYAGNTASGVDPAPLIIKYHEALKAQGVELLLVPAPTKASIYPEKFSAAGAPFPLAPFYKQLTDAGVNVLDLEPIFQAERKKDPAKKLYCEKDSHFSPYATQVIADLIHKKYADSDWAKAIEPEIKFVVGEEKTITIDGDLVSNGAEKLTAVRVTDDNDNQVEPDSDTSPILLLGDSHTVVFSIGGELHTTASGLPDHLQAKFGTRILHVGNNGSGVHAARSLLLRKAYNTPGYWDKKKLVIWHFAARDFTQEAKWIEIPVAKP